MRSWSIPFKKNRVRIQNYSSKIDQVHSEHSLFLSQIYHQVYTHTYIEGNNIEKLIEKKLINSAIIVTEYNIIPLITKFPDTPSSIANRVYVHALARFRYGSLVTYRGTIKAYYQFASGAKFRWPWTRPREPFHFDRTRWGRMFLTVHETDRERERERERENSPRNSANGFIRRTHTI